MTPFIAVLIAGSVLHAITNWITRTPEDDQSPYRWKLWHTFLAGLVSTGALVVIAVLIWLTTSILVPFWAVLLAADLLTVGWKLRQHQHRIRERQALQALLDRPSYGEGA